MPKKTQILVFSEKKQETQTHKDSAAYRLLYPLMDLPYARIGPQNLPLNQTVAGVMNLECNF